MWESQSYLKPDECCARNALFSGNMQELFVCQYKNPHIKCTPFVSSYFLNSENTKASDCFQESVFNIPINPDLIISESRDEPFFCYGRTFPLACTSLYDSIVFDTENILRKHHNFFNFLSDSFQTIWNYQDQIQTTSSRIKTREHRLLYLALHF